MTSNTVTVEPRTSVVSKVERYLDRFAVFSDPSCRLPVALWVIGTHCFESFDAFPYLCITSATKQSGKTRLAELCSFASRNPFFATGATAAGIFSKLADEFEKRPTVFMDEAEDLSSGSAGVMRSFLNSGYRRGQSVTRFNKDYPAYCPKSFILIGDVYDTLRDRSIVVAMRRAEPRERFVWFSASADGAAVAADIQAALAVSGSAVTETYRQHRGLPFFTSDRDEEIWLPLFCLAAVLCPERLPELTANAVDLATAKTADSKRYTNLQEDEDAARDEQYAKRLLFDLHGLLTQHARIKTVDILDMLKAIPAAPWRTFRGRGLTSQDMGFMLARFGVRVQAMRLGVAKARADNRTVKGYSVAATDAAIKQYFPEEKR